MGKLQNKVAVVTGGNSGIGLAIAKKFVDEGAYVYITGRRQAELDKSVSVIGKNVTAVRGDVTSNDDLDRLFKMVSSAAGRIDILVANSGIVEPEPLNQTSLESFSRVFDVNVRGLAFTIVGALPLLPSGGSIIVISSIAAVKGIPGYTAYSGTKAAVRSFVRTWTAELSQLGIRVNSISPGPIDTPIMESQADSKEEADLLRAQFASAVPMGRIGKPEEVAAATLFLASEDASFINGVDLPVDGGMIAV